MASQVVGGKPSSSKSIASKSQTSKTSQKSSSKKVTKGSLKLQTRTPPKNISSTNRFSDVSTTDTIRTTERYYDIITPVRFKALQKRAEEAIKDGKTFLMRARWPIVRKTFLDRGWIELYERHYNASPSGVSKLGYFDLVRHLPVRQSNENLLSYTARCERFVLSRLIEHVPVSFTWSWVPNKTDFDYQLRNPEMIVNKLLVSPFVSKETLSRSLRDNLTWIAKEGEITVNHPRSFSSSDPDQVDEFMQNFRQTACISFLKYMVEKAAKSNRNLVFDNNPSPEVPYSALEFAMQRCYEVLDHFKHSDIDRVQGSLTTDRDWNRFFENHQLLTQKNGQFRKDRIQSVESILRNAEMLLENISPYWPGYKVDGHLNVWILKPADDMCGKGIIISNNLRKLKEVISGKQKTPKRYVIQKYIEIVLFIPRIMFLKIFVECPFNIYDTKFDIRQYFLVTNVYPLEIWLYTESYLRFSTNPYNLNDFDESIHVTNNAIQRKFKLAPKRDSRLPSQNIWGLFAFKEYLHQMGKADVWESKIYPGIKQAIIGTILASQESMIHRNNTFQLYGADLILCDGLNPWVIEINSCPNLYLSTNMTSPIVLPSVNDLLKVIIDRKSDHKVDTGNFELIYKQTLTPNLLEGCRKLSVVGKQISNPTYQVRREMYEHLTQQETTRSDPRTFSRLAQTEETIRRGSNLINTNVRTRSAGKPLDSAATQKSLEAIRSNLKTINRGSL